MMCLICLERCLDDPCLCRDGGTYCRPCITTWVRTSPLAHTGRWKSPRTNEELELPPELNGDSRRCDYALDEAPPRMSSAADWTEGVGRQALARRLAQILSCVNPCPALLEMVGTTSVYALLDRDREAGGEPFLSLTLCWRLFDVAVCDTAPEEWRALGAFLLRHLEDREMAVDCVDLEDMTFTRRAVVDGGDNSRLTRFASGASSLLIPCGGCTDPTRAAVWHESISRGRTRLSAKTIPPALMPHHRRVRRMHMSRRTEGPPPFPEYDPVWEELLHGHQWQPWGDEQSLGIFELDPEQVPSEAEYRALAFVPSGGTTTTSWSRFEVTERLLKASQRLLSVVFV